MIERLFRRILKPSSFVAAFAAVLLCALALMAPPRAGAQDGDEPRIPGGEMVRGVVTKVNGDSFAVKTETGDAITVVATTNTRVMRERQAGKLSEIKPGDGIGAAGVMDAPHKTLHAAVIGVMDAEQVRKAQADLGKTYILGKITAIDELKLTIQRPDGVSQTIAVDEGTSFRRGGRGNAAGAGGGSGDAPPGGGGGESITLADIKVGESVAGRGALRGGVFVPTELRVFNGNRRRPRQAGDSPSGEGDRP